YSTQHSQCDSGPRDVHSFPTRRSSDLAEDSDNAVTTITQSPSVEVTKSVDQENITAPATLNYTITVENTGNVSLTGIAVTDVVSQDGASTPLTLGAPTGEDRKSVV